MVKQENQSFIELLVHIFSNDELSNHEEETYFPQGK